MSRGQRCLGMNVRGNILLGGTTMHAYDTAVGGMAVPLEKVSPRTFMPRHDCPPGHWCLGMNVPSRHYCPPMPDIFFLGTAVPPPPPPPPSSWPIARPSRIGYLAYTWICTHLIAYVGYTIITYSPHTLLDAWVQIQVYLTFQYAKVRSGYAQLAPLHVFSFIINVQPNT